MRICYMCSTKNAWKFLVTHNVYTARNVHPEKFLPLSPSTFIGEISNFIMSCVNAYVEPTMTFTTWAKIYSTEYIVLQCKGSLAALGEL